MQIYNLIKEEYVKLTASENLLYHIENKIAITESVFRLESKSFDDLLSETREFYDNGFIDFYNENDKLIIEQEVEKILDEEYPSSFDMEYFKTLNSFSKRIKYCEEHLQRIGGGSSRIVYKIDDEKVLKLAKNEKGLAQNEVEIEYSGDGYMNSILANVFEYHDQNQWVEMELARKMSKGEFKKIIGISFDVYSDFIMDFYYRNNPSGFNRGGKKFPEEINDFMWENEFTRDILDYIGSYDIIPGDLGRTSTYGIVKRNGNDSIVIIDYGLSKDVFNKYYNNPRKV